MTVSYIRIRIPSEGERRKDVRRRSGEQSGRGWATDLAVVEGAVDGEAVDVRVKDGSHLSLLDGRDAALGEEHEDGDVGLATDTVDGGTESQGGREGREGREVSLSSHPPACLLLIAARPAPFHRLARSDRSAFY